MSAFNPYSDFDLYYKACRKGDSRGQGRRSEPESSRWPGRCQWNHGSTSG